MKEIATIIKTIKNTASLKEKERILREHKDNDQLFTLLKLHENPHDQFYISKIPKVDPKSDNYQLIGKTQYDKFISLTELLKTRKLTGHAAQSVVYNFFKSCNEDEKWVFQTILLKEAMNFGTSLANKVRPGWIPEFDCMLADSEVAKLDEINYPIVAQPKLNGFRAIYFAEQNMFIGRNGKAISNNNLPDYFKKLSQLSKEYVLDGELYSDSIHFNKISSILNSDDKPVDLIYYHVYDIIKKEDWDKQQSNVPYIERWNLLKKLVKEWNLPNLRVIDGFVANNITDVEKFYRKITSAGGEGLMLKSMSGFYNWKRVSVKSQVMMKLKPEHETDGKIIGFEEGIGKFKGQLGAFVVQVEKTKNPVSIGSGISDEDRKEFWNTREDLLGKWILIKYTEITENGESLLFPRFASVRDSKD